MVSKARELFDVKGITGVICNRNQSILLFTLYNNELNRFTPSSQKCRAQYRKNCCCKRDSTRQRLQPELSYRPLAVGVAMTSRRPWRPCMLVYNLRAFLASLRYDGDFSAIVGCGNRSKTDKEKSFFRLPSVI